LNRYLWCPKSTGFSSVRNSSNVVFPVPVHAPWPSAAGRRLTLLSVSPEPALGNA
jgi:hypothetical protein